MFPLSGFRLYVKHMHSWCRADTCILFNYSHRSWLRPCIARKQPFRNTRKMHHVKQCKISFVKLMFPILASLCLFPQH